MLYIEKRATPAKMRQNVAEIKSEAGWRKSVSDPLATTDVIREYFDRLDKDEIRESLVGEQHGLCAYCMKRIHFISKQSPDIEHFVPVYFDKKRALDYSNMLAVCAGGTDLGIRHPIKCCDKNKDAVAAGEEEKFLTISPLDKKMMACIAYDKSGHIRFRRGEGFSDTVAMKIEKDINFRLQLNGEYKNGRLTGNDTSTQLVKGRKDAYISYTRLLKYLGRKGAVSRERLQREIARLENAEIREEFAGVVIYFLRNRLRALD